MEKEENNVHPQRMCCCMLQKIFIEKQQQQKLQILQKTIEIFNDADPWKPPHVDYHHHYDHYSYDAALLLLIPSLFTVD